MTSILECLKERGLLDTTTSADLEEQLKAPTKVYCGFDPSADSLHVGNLIPMIVLRWFQKCGHTPVVILGGATGRIGDPSGKSSERPLLDEATVTYNVARIRRQFEAVLDFFHPHCRPLLLNNEDWYSKFNLIDFLRDVGKHFRLGVMLSKEMVRTRLQSEEGISFTEFTYPLLQAYDFYHLFNEHQVKLQIGGSDQWGNITEGVDLVRRLTSKQVFGLTFPLLLRSDGKKFGKSEQGAIWLASDRCSAYDFYQYFVRVADADVIRLMRMLTFMEMGEIRSFEQRMTRPDYIPNTAQKRLAEEMTRLIHGDEGLTKALRVTQAAAPGAEASLDPTSLEALFKELPSATLPSSEVIGQKFVDLVVKIGLLPSKAEAVRLIQNQGAYLNNERVEDVQFRLSSEHLIGGRYLLFAAGKKKKMGVRIQQG